MGIFDGLPAGRATLTGLTDEQESATAAALSALALALGGTQPEGGALPVTATGGTVQRTLAQRAAHVIDPRDFGAAADGATNDAAAWAAALAVAATRPGCRFVVPAGVSVLPATTTKASALQIPAGVTLQGEGDDSEIRVLASSVAGNGRHFVFTFGSDCTFRDFRFNGNRDAVDRTGITSLQFYGFSPTGTAGTSNILVERVAVHDVIGVNNESFGFTMDTTATPTGPVRGLTYRLCRGWDCEGTPFHADGRINTADAATWDAGFLTEDVLVESCEAYDNTWMGVSLYGTRNSKVLGGRYYRNEKHGVNAEWGRNVEVKGASTYENGRAGVGLYGTVDGTISGNDIHDNNTTLDSTGAEIRLTGGTWHSGSPLPVSAPGRVVISGNTVRPIPGQPHLRMERAAGANAGLADPEAVTLHQPDAYAWRVTSDVADRIPTGLALRGLDTLGVVRYGKVSELALGAGISQATYAGAGATNAVAQTFTGTAQFAKATGRTYAFLAGKTYRLRVRARNEDAASAWGVFVENAANAKLGFVSFSARADEVGEWRTAEAAFRVPADGPYRLQVMQLDSAASTAFTVDFILPALLLGDGLQEESTTSLLEILPESPTNIPDFDTTTDSSDGATAITTEGVLVRSEGAVRRVVRFRAGGTNKAGTGGIAFGNFDSDDILVHRLSAAGPLRFDKLTYNGGASNDVLCNILQLDATGTTGKVGFFGTTAAAKPTVTGSRGGNAALASLLTALAALGLITDSTTA